MANVNIIIVEERLYFNLNGSADNFLRGKFKIPSRGGDLEKNFQFGKKISLFKFFKLKDEGMKSSYLKYEIFLTTILIV